MGFRRTNSFRGLNLVKIYELWEFLRFWVNHLWLLAFDLVEEIAEVSSMACMKLGSKTDAFQRRGQSWFVP